MFFRALAVCALAGLCHNPDARAQAAEPVALSGDIPAQPLADALTVFARQTGLHVAYVSEVVRGKTSHAVTAGLGAQDALTSLLQGTGLRFEFLTPHSVRIVAAAPGPSAPPPPGVEKSQPTTPEVTVTGSRIPVPASITATSPIQIVTAQEILLSGHTDTVDVLGTLPQMTISSAADFGNHSNPAATAGGFTTADLRGLGPQRTVVLVNGRRLGLGDPNTANPTPAPDLDQVPLAMVKRVEVLTGGASATYGSDAIAGVVNFILKDDLQGVQIDGQYGSAVHTQHDAYLQSLEAAEGSAPPSGTVVDGRRRDVAVLAGSGFHDGDGHVTGYFIYQSQAPVYGADRDYADCPFHSTNSLTQVPTDTGVTCFLSGQSNAFVTDAGLGDAYSVVGNQFVPWPAAGSVPPARFNPAPYYTLQRQDTRYQAGLLAHVEVGRAARPYLEFSFMEDRSDTQIAPDGLFLTNNPLTVDGTYRVNCSNPLLSAQEANILCTPAQIADDKAHPGSASADVDIGRRNVEGGGRHSSYEHRNYRVVAGMDGRLGSAWSYDAYGLYYYTSLYQEERNFLNWAAINNALEVTSDPSGHPVCISRGSCVPYNIFASGAVTQQQLAYLYSTGTDGGANSEQIVEADVTGQLGRYGLSAPWTHEGVAVNAGLEHRTDTLSFAPDAVELSGDLVGWGVAAVAIDQRVSVNEGFIEVRVPVAQDQPLINDLTIDAGYRYSVYSTAGTANTYKFDLQFAPVTDLRLRASYDHVIRAPNLIELYTPLSYTPSVFIDTDPCAPTNHGATHAAASLSQCMHTGVTATQYGNGLGPAVGGTNTIVQCAIGCGVVAGGNPQLAPETADTWSVGLTFTPTGLPTLTGSVDYFHIHLKGEIGTVPESVTLQQCLTTGDPVLCSQIVRTPAGALSGASLADGGYILANAVNTGAALVSGADVQLNYRQALPGRWGEVSVSLTGSWLQHHASTPYRSAPSYDCAGLFGATCLNGSVNPTWRHILRVNWETRWNMLLSAQWRFIGSTEFDNNSPQPLLQNEEEGFYDPVLTRIPNYSYLDLSAVWAVTRHAQVRVGANNVFDKDPPFVPLEVSGAAGNLNTFPAYDVLGRTLFMGFRLTF
ncbi:MAG TPA: TonB-dependent receptor [Candidatus Margulisiibacteriota bacterium]|nr:TonB-dependent receptor [Candidatus Margulisiibacteriota bacterium]